MSARKVLVTGAAGFLGRHLLGALCACDSNVLALVRPGKKGLEAHISPGMELFEGDLNDPRSLDGRLRQVDTVYHLAAKYLPGNSESTLRELRLCNVDTTRNLLDACLKQGVRRFIHVSSAAACERSGREHVDEDSGQPVSAYGITKRESEELLRSAPEGSIAWTVLRPTVIFGEHGEGPIVQLARAIQSGRFRLIGSGKNHVNFIYAGDVASAMLQMAELPIAHGKTYLLADEPARFREVFGLNLSSAVVVDWARR